MNVIVIESEAFYELIEKVVEKISRPEQDKWIFEDEAMAILGIKSKTTLWDLRSKGKIRFSQPSKKSSPI